MNDPDLNLKKFQKELSAGTVSLALMAVLAKAEITDCLPMPKNNRLINQRASC